MSTVEILMVSIGFLTFGALGYYGRNTSLGFFGSLLVGVITTPILGFLIVYFFRKRSKIDQNE